MNKTSMPVGRKESFDIQAVELHRRHPVILIHDHEPLSDDLAQCRTAGIAGKVLSPVLDVIIPNHIIQSTETGLTAFGRELIRELNRLGIIIDVAHAGQLVCRQVLFQYVAETVGVDVLALGCDYFPRYGGWVQLLPKHDATRDHFVLPKERLPRLTSQLLARGWREEDIAKVLGGNFLRLCERVLR